jgi:hypothetical protein
MSLAIGGASASVTPPSGYLWVDVRDYGAKADSGATDNSIPFQAAVDDLASRLSSSPANAKGIVFIPSAPQPYFLAKSVWVDAPNIEIRGEGWGSFVQMSATVKSSPFIFGIKRIEAAFIDGSWVPLTIDETHRPDLFGKLDTSAVTAPGKLWGLRTKGDSFVQFQACPLAAGVGNSTNPTFSDAWNETSKLTIEFCIEPPDGQQFPVNAPLFGCGKLDFEISPFFISVWDDPQKILVMFRTSDMDTGGGPNRLFGFSLAEATPPYRIAVQFDLDNAVCSAFVNGVQVALTTTVNMSPASEIPFVPNSGLTFLTNDHYPFKIGGEGIFGALAAPTGVDLRVYGLRLSNTIRYQNRGPNLPQLRTDSPASPINDAYAYFGQDANTICFLRGTDNPATAGRIVSVQHGTTAVLDGITTGIFLNSLASSFITGNAIRDIFVQASGGYGQAICLGNVLEMTIENVKATGGFHGVGSFALGSNYNVYLNNCALDGTDAGYFGAWQILYARDIFFGTIGRVAMRHVGCNAAWQNVFVGFPSPTTEAVFKARTCDYGGAYSITNLLVDFEGSTVTRAGIYCEATATAPASSLLLKDIFFGTVGSSIPLIQLKDTAKGNPLINRGWLSVDNFQAFTNDYLAFIDVDGPLWHGEVMGVALNGPQFNHRQKWGTNTNIVIRDSKYTGPPRAFLWYNGAHLLQVRSPAAGQFTEWRCVATGRYGTPNPPTWAGLNPLPTSANSLAAYVLNHAYMTVNLS